VYDKCSHFNHKHTWKLL